MRDYTFVAPRHDLPDHWAAELRAVIVGRDDIRAAYWLTTLYESDEGTVAQDERHVELAEPPEQAADGEQFRWLAHVLPSNGPVFSIPPRATLAEVRKVGLRVA